MAAAVSAKSLNNGERSSIGCLGARAISATRSPTCRLNQRTPAMAHNGSSIGRAIERLGLNRFFGLPDQARPTFRLEQPEKCFAHAAIASAGGVRYGTERGMVSSLVSKRWGRLSIGQWR